MPSKPAVEVPVREAGRDTGVRGAEESLKLDGGSPDLRTDGRGVEPDPLNDIELSGLLCDIAEPGLDAP